MSIAKAESIKAMKRREKIAALTAYDFPMTKFLDDAGIPLILVGDSLGMVVLGYSDTTHVTMDEIVHHLKAGARNRGKRMLPSKTENRNAFTLWNQRERTHCGVLSRRTLKSKNM